MSADRGVADRLCHARELRDRNIEQINAGLLLPPSACGKYDVSRALEAASSSMKLEPVALLNAA